MKMKKILFVTVALLLVFQNFYVQALEYEPPAELRVGLTSLYNEVDFVPISNTGILIGYEEGGFFQTAVNLSSFSGFIAAPGDDSFIPTGQNFSSYQDAKDYGSGLAGALPVYKGAGLWTVYLPGQGGEMHPSNYRVILSWDGEALILDCESGYPQIMDGSGGYISLGDRSYRGRIELYRKAYGGLTPINIVLIEEYLYSTVPSEMPAVWHIEALKAQAVVCRNYTEYAATKVSKHTEAGYNLCDSSHCQNYKGAESEFESSTLAVHETSGLMIYYEDEIINSTFFSSSGGYTANSGEVWAYQLPYMVSVQEINEAETKEWTRSFTLNEITQLLYKNGKDIGQAVSVSIGSISAQGRVNQLVIAGTYGVEVLEKEAIRTFFSSSAGGLLESRLFTVDTGIIQSQAAAPESFQAVSVTSQGIQQAGNVYINSAQNAVYSGEGVTFTGRGWGHGVGMSQYGAKGMAELGFDFTQILQYYFTGVSVR